MSNRDFDDSLDEDPDQSDQYFTRDFAPWGRRMASDYEGYGYPGGIMPEDTPQRPFLGFENWLVIFDTTEIPDVLYVETQPADVIESRPGLELMIKAVCVDRLREEIAAGEELMANLRQGLHGQLDKMRKAPGRDLADIAESAERPPLLLRRSRKWARGLSASWRDFGSTRLIQTNSMIRGS